ncbi:MAG: ABC transporter substrate-binding protein [Deltaproteobacteria bacterium]|nr:ABC transporter substrate-binding protein [Deltaproteobacteria bacterium]
MDSVRRSKAIWAGAGLCALLLWAATVDAQANGMKKVRLAYSGWGISTAVAYVGIDGGIFKKYGLEVDEVFIRDTLSGGIHALIGVDFVLGFGNSISVLQPILERKDIVFLASHITMERYDMGVTAGIASIKDLKGKKIGVSGPGQKSDLIARILLRRAGLDPVRDVEFVSAGLSPNRIAALVKNLIQAAPITQDVASQAKRLGVNILEAKEVPVTTALLMTSRTVINRDEDVVRRFMKGYLAAIQFFLSHKVESIAIVRKYLTNMDPQTIENMYEEFAAQLTPVPGPNREALQSLIDSVSAGDKRARDVNPVNLFEPRFLEELKQSGFIDDLYTEKVSL